MLKAYTFICSVHVKDLSVEKKTEMKSRLIKYKLFRRNG